MDASLTRTSVSLPVGDLASFARSLARQLGSASPSHLSLMNMLARAAGFRNYQHLLAAQHLSKRLVSAPRQVEPVDHKLVARTLQQFDKQGRLRQWPSKRSVQEKALWALWAHLPAARSMTEREISELLSPRHLFADAAILRRSMIGMGLATRSIDGTDYQRVERRPSPEARELIRMLKTSERRRYRRRGAHKVRN